jgi:hypothetical protein
LSIRSVGPDRFVVVVAATGDPEDPFGVAAPARYPRHMPDLVLLQGGQSEQSERLSDRVTELLAAAMFVSERMCRAANDRDLVGVHAEAVRLERITQELADAVERESSEKA